MVASYARLAIMVTGYANRGHQPCEYYGIVRLPHDTDASLPVRVSGPAGAVHVILPQGVTG
jgi:hypothetical protein